MYSTVEQLWWGKDHALINRQGRFYQNIIGSDLFYNSSQEDTVIACFDTVSVLLAPATPEHNPGFYLSFTRRNLDINIILAIARKVGLEGALAEDYCYDIFGNNTEGQTELWRDAIYVFRRLAS